ncbi:hypothetical protein EMCRGX_G009473 [Ephydatia muelleri]
MMAHLVASGVAALVIVLLSLASTSDARSAVRSTAAEGTTTERESDGYSVLNVMDYGAVGDGVTDNIDAFQDALNAAVNGGTVYVPPGQFAFKANTTITVPRGVSLLGSYRSVPSHAVDGGSKPDVGSVLLPYGGQGSDEGCFLQLSEDSTVSGFTVYYPSQPPDQIPQPYPWTFCLSGNNPTLTDVECLNCWNAIYAVLAHRHYIARIQGQPINTGIYVDQIYDIGRIEDVHWNPWYSGFNKQFMSWQLVHGRAFVFGRTDWEYVFNTFAFGYAIGYHFIATDAGGCNGNFLGIGADMMVNASVQVDQADPYGILITNGEFTAFVDSSFGIQADSTEVIVGPSNAGSIRFVNCAFWGPSNQIAKLSGQGTTGFSDCTFNAWDAQKKGNSAIIVDGATGSLQVRGCDFQQDGNQINLSTTLKKAVITGNIFTGSTRIAGKARNTQVGLNADDG